MSTLLRGTTREHRGVALVTGGCSGIGRALAAVGARQRPTI